MHGILQVGEASVVANITPGAALLNGISKMLLTPSLHSGGFTHTLRKVTPMTDYLPEKEMLLARIANPAPMMTLIALKAGSYGAPSLVLGARPADRVGINLMATRRPPRDWCDFANIGLLETAVGPGWCHR